MAEKFQMEVIESKEVPSNTGTSPPTQSPTSTERSAPSTSTDPDPGTFAGSTISVTELFNLMTKGELNNFKGKVEELVVCKCVITSTNKCICPVKIVNIVNIVNNYKIKLPADNKDNRMTLLQHACIRGLYDYVKEILDLGADPEIKRQGTSETVLHLVMRKDIDDNNKKSKSKYLECLSYLMEEHREKMKKIINNQDNMGNTALHHAVELGWPDKQILKLLQLGAKINLKNKRGDIPLEHIPPETISDFMNKDCILDESNDTGQFKVTFSYTFWEGSQKKSTTLATVLKKCCLQKPSANGTQDVENGQVRQQKVDGARISETNCILRMSRLSSHRHLISHPVVASFIWQKWKQNGRIIKGHLLFYLFFVLCLTVLIYSKFEHANLIGQSSNKTNETSEQTMKINNLHTTKETFAVLATICLTLLMIIEAFQIASTLTDISSMIRYFMNVKNWIDWFLIVIGLWLIHHNSMPSKTDRCLAAFAVVLGWAELITIYARQSRFQSFNKYIYMFHCVLKSFFKAIACFGFLVAAFGLGFFIIQSEDQKDEVSSSSEEKKFFLNPLLALVKTSTMLVGELDTSNIDIDQVDVPHAVIGYLFLLTFVFLIVIVLMNFLIGLAASDITAIEKESYIISHITRAEFIFYAESFRKFLHRRENVGNQVSIPFVLGGYLETKGLEQFKVDTACQEILRSARRIIEERQRPQ